MSTLTPALRDTEITLNRSGERPLVFRGHLVSEAGSAPENKHVVRWHEIKLYRSASGLYVLAVNFKTTSRHEQPFDDAFVLDSAEDVATCLEEYDPVDYVIGWPVPKYQDRDDRLREALEASFDQLVTRILSSTNEFAERVE